MPILTISQCGIDALKLKEAPSSDSQSTVRTKYNANFALIKKAFACVGEYLSTGIQLIPPTTPVIGQNYVVQYTGGSWILMETSPQYGTKYVIHASETITVQDDHQYIVNDTLFLFGTLNLEPTAQLVLI